MSENISFIPSRLKNAASGGHVAGASDIIDDVKNKTQETINAETDARFSQMDDEIEALEKQDVVPVDTLPDYSTADPKKIYRVADETSYTDYMVNAEGTGWKEMAEFSFPGIDNVPIPGSNNLVKSGGIPQIFCSSEPHDYSPYISEIYINENMPAGNIAFKYYNGRVFLYAIGSGVYSRLEPSPTENGIYAVEVYDSTDPSYPVGTIVGYVLINDYDGLITKPGTGSGQDNNVNRIYCENLNNSLEIAYQKGLLKSKSSKDSDYAINSLNCTNIVLPSTEHSSFIKEAYLFGSGLDKTKTYRIGAVSRGHSQYDWSIFIYNAPGQEQSNIVCRMFENPTEPENPVLIPAYNDSNINAYLILNWDAFENDTNNRADILFTDRVFDLNYSPIIQEYLRSKQPDDVVIAVPDVINAVVGDTLQLFYMSIFKCVNPYIYDISVICDIGAQYPRYYEVTPSADSIGDHTITFRIKDNNNNLINEKVATLKVVSAGTSPQTDLNVFCIGASCTVNGQWPSEMKRRLIGNGGTPASSRFNPSKINFVGRMDVTFEGKQVNLEATGGYQFSSYNSLDTLRFRFYVTAENEPTISIGDIYSNNGNNYEIVEINIDAGQGGNFSCEGSVDPIGNTLTRVRGTGSETVTYSSVKKNGNPLVHNGAIDIQWYADEYCNPQNMSHGKIDVVFTELFGNGIRQYTDNFTSRLADMQTFINNFRAVFPNVKFCIGLFWNPDIRGGMGANYGAPVNGLGDPYAIKYTNMNLCNALQKYITDNNMGDYVYILNWLNEFDEENSMQQTMKPVNTRSSVTEVFGINGVHPSIVGYNQMADSAWRVFVAKFCQGT